MSVEGGRILLNRRPIYVKMVLDQGYWPESILTPPSDEAIQYDIKMTKEMGFNGARKHQKLEDPRFLYWADTMGLLVSSEMANAYDFNEAYVERFTREWMAAVERDYSHPSVVMWVPINESWGTPNLHDPRQQNHLKALYTLTKSFDSTRPVIDNDGWEHTDMTDIFALHDYARTGDLLLEKYKDAGKPGVRIPDNGRAALAPGFAVQRDTAGALRVRRHCFHTGRTRGAEGSLGILGRREDAGCRAGAPSRAVQGHRESCRSQGICYTQITDVEQEINGLMTYDRKPKFDAKAVREINAMVQ